MASAAVTGRARLSELLNLAELRALIEQFQRTTGIAVRVMDLLGTVIVEASGQRVCFTAHHVTAEGPARSGPALVPRVVAEGQVEDRCEAGLRRVARTVAVDGEPVAVITAGQFLFPDDVLDPEDLRTRALDAELTEEELRRALAEVPRISRERSREAIEFLARLLESLSRAAVARLRLERDVAQLTRSGSQQFAAIGSQQFAAIKPHLDKPHLEKLLNSIADPLFVKDRQHRWLFLNDAFCQFMGHAREELIGKSDYDFFPTEEASVFWEIDEVVFATGEENLNEECLTDSHGVKHTILTKKALYEDRSGEQYIVGIIRDITERKQTEQALIRSQQLAGVGTLAAGVSHEFNNINTSVIGNLQLMISSQELTPRARELTQRAIRAAERATDITRRLLDFAIPGAFEQRPADLNSIVTNTAAIVEDEFASEGITLALTPGEVGPALLDPSQISQVVMNLLINARDAVLARPTRRIGVTTGSSGSRIFVRVADTGCGISPERLPKVFLPFFSGKGEHASDDPIQSMVRGSGLGLSISDTIVRNHGGEIAVVSKPGHGSTFTVWLPVAQANVRPPRRAPVGEVPEPVARPPAKSGRILVLDDERDVRELLHSVLTPCGHELVSTGDGHEALAEHARRPFDVALVDLQMAGMSGFEFLSELGADRPEVVVITGRMQSDLEEQVRRWGASKLLMKPFDVGHLRRLVHTLLAQRQARHSG